MTNRAHILLQNYVDAVHEFRCAGGTEREEEEMRAMDAAELELTQYITGLEKYREDQGAAAAENFND